MLAARTHYSKTLFTTTIKLARYKVKTRKLQATSYDTCNLKPITAYRPIDGISPLSGISRLLIERALDDCHHDHGRGSANFLATINFYCGCFSLIVACCVL